MGGGGIIIGCTFLFTGRWAYNWGVIKLRTNNSEHCWHCWPNNVGGCYVRLHVAKSLTGFKLYATTPPNNTQQGVQTNATCNIQQSWELLTNNREFKQQRRRRQRGRQKSSWFWLAKQQLCTCITLFCTFLCRHCTTTTWKCLISRFVENVNTKQWLSFSFLQLRYNPLEFNPRKTANIWRI